MNRLLLNLLTGVFCLASTLGLSGCGGDFVYRGERFGLPEEAVARHQSDTAAAVAALGPELVEKRQPLPVTIVLPNTGFLQRQLPASPAASDPVADAYFTATMTAAQLRGYADAIKTFAIFPSVEIVSSSDPVRRLGRSGAWRLFHTRNTDGTWAWWLAPPNGGRVQLVDFKAPRPSPDAITAGERFVAPGAADSYDLFKDALLAAIDPTRFGNEDAKPVLVRADVLTAWTAGSDGGVSWRAPVELTRRVEQGVAIRDGAFDALRYQLSIGSAQGEIKEHALPVLRDTLVASFAKGKAELYAPTGSPGAWKLYVIVSYDDPELGERRYAPVLVVTQGARFAFAAVEGPAATIFPDGIPATWDLKILPRMSEMAQAFFASVSF
jgi:hypothetical protein